MKIFFIIDQETNFKLKKCEQNLIFTSINQQEVSSITQG